MDLHEGYEALKAQLDHLGIDSNIIDSYKIEEPNDDITAWTVMLPPKGNSDE